MARIKKFLFEAVNFLWLSMIVRVLIHFDINRRFPDVAYYDSNFVLCSVGILILIVPIYKSVQQKNEFEDERKYILRKILILVLVILPILMFQHVFTGRYDNWDGYEEDFLYSIWEDNYDRTHKNVCVNISLYMHSKGNPPETLEVLTDDGEYKFENKNFKHRDYEYFFEYDGEILTSTFIRKEKGNPKWFKKVTVTNVMTDETNITSEWLEPFNVREDFLKAIFSLQFLWCIFLVVVPIVSIIIFFKSRYKPNYR